MLSAISASFSLLKVLRGFVELGRSRSMSTCVTGSDIGSGGLRLRLRESVNGVGHDAGAFDFAGAGEVDEAGAKVGDLVFVVDVIGVRAFHQLDEGGAGHGLAGEAEGVFGGLDVALARSAGGEGRGLQRLGLFGFGLLLVGGMD